MLISLPVQNGRHFKNSYFSHLTDFSAMAPYPIFFRALKTIIMPNFMLLTESEQFKHVSAPDALLTICFTRVSCDMQIDQPNLLRRYEMRMRVTL